MKYFAMRTVMMNSPPMMRLFLSLSAYTMGSSCTWPLAAAIHILFPQYSTSRHSIHRIFGVWYAPSAGIELMNSARTTVAAVMFAVPSVNTGCLSFGA